MVVWESRTSRWCVHNRDDPDVTVNVGLVDLVRYSQPGWFSDEYARSWNMIISLLHCCVSALGTNSLITSWRTNGPDVRLCVGNTWKIRDKDKRSTTVTAKSWIRIPRSCLPLLIVSRWMNSDERLKPPVRVKCRPCHFDVRPHSSF